MCEIALDLPCQTNSSTDCFITIWTRPYQLTYIQSIQKVKQRAPCWKRTNLHQSEHLRSWGRNLYPCQDAWTQKSALSSWQLRWIAPRSESSHSLWHSWIYNKQPFACPLNFSLSLSSDFIFFFVFIFFLFHSSSVIKRLFDRNQQETIKKLSSPLIWAEKLMLWTRTNRRNKWTHKQVYKQSFFYLHRLVGSCAPLLHRRGRSQAARRSEKPDHPPPPKARIFRLCQPETLRIWGGLPRLDRRVHRLPLPDRRGSGLGTPRNRPREVLRGPRTRRDDAPPRAQPRLQLMLMPPGSGRTLGQRLREPNRGRAPEESAAPRLGFGS